MIKNPVKRFILRRSPFRRVQRPQSFDLKNVFFAHFSGEDLYYQKIFDNTIHEEDDFYGGKY
jgi:hypothetical protein